jgi:small-conductance mechanosensitive channel
MKEYLDSHQFQWIGSLLVIVSWFMLKLIIARAIDRISLRFEVIPERRKTIIRIINIILFSSLLVTILAFWGIESKQLLLFVTSTLTFLGVAFFAQWSILSNITSGIVLFFHHPIRMGDKIRIVDKDFFIEGKVDSISLFFMHIINEEGEKITVPNNIALQKTISICHKSKE